MQDFHLRKSRSNHRDIRSVCGHANGFGQGLLKIDPLVTPCLDSEEVSVLDAVDGWDFAADNARDFMRNIHASGFGSGMAVP